MSDIRKRTGKRGITYQVRYQSIAAASGYAFKTFSTLKEARAFREDSPGRRAGTTGSANLTIAEAAERWLSICETEGLNGREPVTTYTLENYSYRARFIKAYSWPKPVQALTPPDIVLFRSWLLGGQTSRSLAGKVLSTLHSVLEEMKIRGVIAYNPASGICVRSDSRYREPVVIPSKRDVLALLTAADSLANSRNQTIANAWRRYRPMLYLAADTGMRPQEYLALARASIHTTGVRVERALDGSGAELSVTKTVAGRRFIEVSPDTLEMVRDYADNHAIKNAHDLAFPSESGGWQCRRNWQHRGFDVACENAGLMELVDIGGREVERPKFRPYDLRHFFASLLIERKINLKKIQTLMGHENIETTLNVYGHLLDDAGDDFAASGILHGLRSESCGKSVAQRG